MKNGTQSVLAATPPEGLAREGGRFHARLRPWSRLPLVQISAVAAAASAMIAGLLYAGAGHHPRGWLVVLGHLAALSIATGLILSGRRRRAQQVRGRRTAALQQRAALQVSEEKFHAVFAEQQQAERARRETEERLTLALEATEEGIWDWRIPDGQLYFSPRCARLLGYEPEELADLTAVRQLIHPDDLTRSSAIFGQHLESDAPAVDSEMRMRARSGEWRWMLTRAKVVRWDEQGRPLRMVGVFTDITERKTMQSRLLLADRMASIGALAAGVAHEINNPLAYVIANLSFAQRALAELTRAPAAGAIEPDPLFEARNAVEEAREGTDQVRAIVRDLRTLSRSDDEECGPVDVNQVLQSSLQFAAHEIKRRARVQSELSPVPPVQANSLRLGQVFLNLLVNAAQAIPEGRPDQNRIRVASRSDGSRVVVEIQDTGAGIAPQVLGKIFEPFFTTKRAGEGTGLGLAICQGIVTALGGEIQVETRPGEGSTFRVLLPVARQPVAEAPQTSPAAPARRARILAVEHDPRLGKEVERLLVPDHEVVTRSTPGEALAMVSSGESFDLVLCELMMPEVTGMDLHEQLKGACPRLAERMVFLVGGALTPRARQFLESIPNPRIEKPFKPEVLQAMVRDLLLAERRP